MASEILSGQFGAKDDPVLPGTREFEAADPGKTSQFDYRTPTTRSTGTVRTGGTLDKKELLRRVEMAVPDLALEDLRSAEMSLDAAIAEIQTRLLTQAAVQNTIKDRQTWVTNVMSNVLKYARPPLSAFRREDGTHYFIHDPFAGGGMGIAARVESEAEPEADLVIKMMNPTGATDPHRGDFLRRARDERLYTRKLKGMPGVVQYVDGGEVLDDPYLVMLACRGVTLDDLLNAARRAGREGLPPEFVRILGHRLAQTMEAVHNAEIVLTEEESPTEQPQTIHGIIHRDLKPSNIMTNGAAEEVMDFGIARFKERVGPGLTETGVGLGSLDHMAPEQRSAKYVDARADVYALGSTLYNLLTGKPFVPGKEKTAAFKKQTAVRTAEHDLELQRWKPVDPELVGLLDEMLQEDVEKRPKTMAVVMRKLKEMGVEDKSFAPATTVDSLYLYDHSKEKAADAIYTEIARVCRYVDAVLQEPGGLSKTRMGTIAALILAAAGTIGTIGYRYSSGKPVVDGVKAESPDSNSHGTVPIEKIEQPGSEEKIEEPEVIDQKTPVLLKFTHPEDDPGKLVGLDYIRLLRNRTIDTEGKVSEEFLQIDGKNAIQIRDANNNLRSFRIDVSLEEVKDLRKISGADPIRDIMKPEVGIVILNGRGDYVLDIPYVGIYISDQDMWAPLRKPNGTAAIDYSNITHRPKALDEAGLGSKKDRFTKMQATGKLPSDPDGDKWGGGAQAKYHAGSLFDKLDEKLGHLPAYGSIESSSQSPPPAPDEQRAARQKTGGAVKQE
ncbi:serine/threonine protein kinase [Candidatus Peregrinibacteria bacterium]|nr:serine/threonine protein kinase [Candidatus Peregrinibacteria bacterium]